MICRQKLLERNVSNSSRFQKCLDLLVKFVPTRSMQFQIVLFQFITFLHAPSLEYWMHQMLSLRHRFESLLTRRCQFLCKTATEKSCECIQNEVERVAKSHTYLLGLSNQTDRVDGLLVLAESVV